MVKLNLLVKHTNTCARYHLGSSIPGKRCVQVLSEILHCKINSGASQMLVFSIITQDELTAVVQNDALVISFGEFGLSKSVDNRLKCNYYISQYRRQAGRFLLELKKVTEG